MYFKETCEEILNTEKKLRSALSSRNSSTNTNLQKSSKTFKSELHNVKEEKENDSIIEFSSDDDELANLNSNSEEDTNIKSNSTEFKKQNKKNKKDERVIYYFFHDYLLIIQ